MPEASAASTSSVELDVLRHSAAHLLAAAVCELYPGAQYAIGPAIEDGFYYDFDLGHTLKEEDLEPIETRMREIASRRPPYVQERMDKGARWRPSRSWARATRSRS